MSQTNPDCDDHQGAYLEGDEEAAVHARSCDRCQMLVAELDTVRDVLTHPAAWAEPDPGLEDRILAAVTGEMAHVAAIPPVAAPPNLAVAPEPVRPQRRQRERFALPRLAWGLAAAACVAGILLGAIGAGILGRDPGADAEFALRGTELAPQARAEVALREDDNGVEIRLDISGLPRAPSGFYYQAWVKDDGGLVPIGTFHTGRGEVVLWSGVSPDRYRAITVTIEEEGGDPASSGRRVLVGESPPR